MMRRDGLIVLIVTNLPDEQHVVFMATSNLAILATTPQNGKAIRTKATEGDLI